MGDMLQDIAYDFVICGGGTSGCVIASRLAENPDVSVLVIEAGEHSEHLENVHMTGGWSQLFDKETDWNVVSEKKPAVNDRQVKLSRGKFLGGCSGCNGTLAIRGAKQDYDDWGVEGWSGEDFFRYIRKAENFHGKSWFKASDDHGTDGHLHIEPHDLAPISDLIMDSMVSKGLPLDHDMFSHAADFVSKDNAKDNLHILVETHVEKVLIENVDGDLKATGVKAVKSDGSVIEIKARKEVIVSGGAYCSPNILNRSGIGATSELQKFGIPTLVELPGVGKNLMDHLIVFMFYETEKAGLTNDHHVYHGDNFAKTYALWKDQQAGFLSSFPFGVFAYARLDERLADSDLWKNASREPGRDPMGLTPRQPNIEFFTTECYGGPKQFDKFPTDGKYAFSMIAELFGPRSRGTVTLRNTDPKAVPVVDTNYLADPLDVEVLAEACRFGNEIIMEGKGTKDIVKGSWPSDLVHHKYSTREDWIPYVRDNATTCYHAAGTCAMGKTTDPNAVVDSTLTVKGVKGLRVADCSIMPILNGGHTQMPAYGIGEKAADLIKATWDLQSTRNQI
ncbi:hypothetical protein EsH8_V_000896 [Colletotrichum jinshuiense]